VQEGRERQQLKSGPVPESNDGPVKVVVGRTLYDAVLDSGRNGTCLGVTVTAWLINTATVLQVLIVVGRTLYDTALEFGLNERTFFYCDISRIVTL